MIGPKGILRNSIERPDLGPAFTIVNPAPGVWKDIWPILKFCGKIFQK